jgi:uncharacterized protein YciI
MKTLLACLCLATLPVAAHAGPELRTDTAPVIADPELAIQLGADQRGMRQYMLVILKSGPTPVTEGPQRSAMFAGHFANMQRLAQAGKLAVAGPFTDKGDWRGLFILAVTTQAEAEALVATDPVIAQGEMVAEYHPLYASAALMAVNATHLRIAPQ